MEFRKFGEAVHGRYNELAKGELFVVDVDDIFATYLAAFPEGTDPIYRERTTHDCQCCKQFIRKLGVLVSINKNWEIETIWDGMDHLPHPYNIVAARLADVVRQAPIRCVFRSKEKKYSVDHNFDTHNDERHDHFWGDVHRKHYSKEPETQRGEKDATAQVLRRGLKELRLSDVETVLDLINSNALYRGEEHKHSVEGFRKLLKGYDGTEVYIWANLDDPAARFRNTAIGTLIVDLSADVELEVAVKSFESKVAPQNYKRPTALITKRMVEEADAKLKELGIEGAVHRRFARLEDVSVNNVIFVDNKTRPKMRGGKGISDILADQVKPPEIKLDHATPISIDDFVSTVVPTATSMAVLVKNKHLGNFVSLTGGDGPERLFRWNNNFAWSYDGDVTDSIKQRVKAAGGNIDAKLRVSLAWYNHDDLDLHAILPSGDRVYYGNKMGILDVDMNAGYGRTRTPVENLAFQKLSDGVYKIFVNQFCKRESIDTGFALEIEYEGALHQFSYGKAVRDRMNVEGFTLTVKNGRMVEMKPGESLVGGSQPTDKWGIQTENLVPVSVMMNSPNHWDGNRVGQKHTFFMLQGCKNPDAARGIYPEFLRADLDKHRKVFEVLGSKTKCPPTEDQISGVGFTAARNDSVIAVVNGKRAYNINF